MIRHCDFGHETTDEVRRLPTSEDSGIFVCREHYEKQVDWWEEQGGNIDDVPDFEDLPLQYKE